MNTNYGTVKFAFYEPKWNDFFGQAIAWYTRLFNWGAKNYSHVEIGLKINGEWAWYSAASKADKPDTTCTRWISPAKLFVHPERWNIIEVYAQRPYLDMIETAEAEKDKPYDWSGIFSFIEPFSSLNNKNKWYCSEICEYVFYGKWTRRISPERLSTRIIPYNILPTD